VAVVVGVPDLKVVPAKAAEAVAPLRARAGRGRGRVQEEVHAFVAVEIGDDDLPHIGEIGVRLGVAREARVGLGVGVGGLGQAAVTAVQEGIVFTVFRMRSWKSGACPRHAVFLQPFVRRVEVWRISRMLVSDRV